MRFGVVGASGYVVKRVGMTDRADARVDTYSDRAEALDAAGLSG